MAVIGRITIHPVTIREPATYGQGPMGRVTRVVPWPPWPVDFGPVPPCRHQKSLQIHALDGSDSITRHHGADPLGRRLDEAQYALRRFARTCRRCEAEQAAVLHFDSSECDRPPTPLTKAGIESLCSGLVLPPGGTGSNLGPSLSQAEQLAAAHPDHQVNLVIYSDYELFDNPSAIGRLGDFPGTIYAIVLGVPVRAELVDDTRIHVTQVTANSRPGVVARAVWAAACAARQGGIR